MLSRRGPTRTVRICSLSAQPAVALLMAMELDSVPPLCLGPTLIFTVSLESEVAASFRFIELGIVRKSPCLAIPGALLASSSARRGRRRPHSEAAPSCSQLRHRV